MISLNYSRTLALLESVVKGNEGLIYECPQGKDFCSYVAGKNTQGCGVGQVFRRAGVRTLDLFRLDEMGSVAAISRIPDAHDIVQFEDAKTVRLLSNFQNKQDQGVEWGTALSIAKVEGELYD